MAGGQAITSAQGSVTQSVSIALVGLAIASATGALAYAEGDALTGSESALAAGDLGSARLVSLKSRKVGGGSASRALTGTSSTSETGTLANNVSVAVSGQQIATAQGALAKTRSKTLTGSSVVVGQGSVTVSSQQDATWVGLVPNISFSQGIASSYGLVQHTLNFNSSLHRFEVLAGTLPTGVTLNPSTGYVYNGTSPVSSQPNIQIRIADIGLTAESDFQARATAPGVFRVRNWTTSADLGGGFGSEFGNLTQGSNPAPVIDTNTKPFGNGSLRFDVLPILGGSMWWTNMSADLSLQFGSSTGGETVYFQFPYRVSAEIPPTYAAKIFLFGTGDTTGNFVSSCTDLEIEMNSQIFGQKFLAAYNACPGSCGANSVFTFFPGAANPGGQQFLVANEWLTITVGVTLGPRETHINHDWFVDSNVKMWIQRGTSPRILLYDVTMGPNGTPGWTPSANPPIWGLCAGQTVGQGQRYGKLWLLPYNQELTGTNQQPGSIWYGPLIMSTQPIAARLA